VELGISLDVSERDGGFACRRCKQEVGLFSTFAKSVNCFVLGL
jgi:hypothetical protein